MSHSDPARAASRGTRRGGAVALAVVFAAAVTTVGLSAPSAFRATSSEVVLGGRAVPGPPSGSADGEVPAGVTVLDDAYPAIAKLDPALVDALRGATGDAADDGVELVVTSGWRSRAYQRELLREAVVQHGTAAAAARWVLSPEQSKHVSGDAVDVGGVDGRAWLAEHGARHGLCRVYDNEPWHFELRPQAEVEGCPATYPDPTYDPGLGSERAR